MRRLSAARRGLSGSAGNYGEGFGTRSGVRTTDELGLVAKIRHLNPGDAGARRRRVGLWFSTSSTWRRTRDGPHKVIELVTEGDPAVARFLPHRTGRGWKGRITKPADGY